MAQYNIRQGTKEDAPAILKLFNKQAPEHKRDMEFWEWINEDTLITVAEQDGEIIGHHAIIPKQLHIGNSVYPVGMGIHAIVKPNTVSIMEITKHNTKLAIDKGLVMLYSFPNQNYWFIKNKIEKWDIVSQFKSIEFDVYDRPNTTIRLIEERVSGWEFKTLINGLTPRTHPIKINTEFYKRYFEHPHNIYKTYSVYKANNFAGFVILKVFNNKKGHIVDYIIDKSLDYKDLIDGCVDMLYNYKMSLWPTNPEFSKEIKGEDGFQTNFLVKFLDDTFESQHRDYILDINNWHLPMGTSDAI